MKATNFKKKPELLTYRTPDRFKRLATKKNIGNVAMTARPRCFGGHR